MPFDQTFIKPSGLDLIDALKVAQAVVNAEEPILKEQHEDWEAAVRAAKGVAEGVREWNGMGFRTAGGVMLAWWTDRLGRRHFRVAGRPLEVRSFHRGPDHISRGLPPAFVLAGPHSFLQRIDQEDSRCLVCACGEKGDPERLGWMGDCCAACHDRRELGEAIPVRASVGPAPPARDPLQSPDGRWSVRLAPDHIGIVGEETDERFPLRAHDPRLSWSVDGRSLAIVAGSAHVFRLGDEGWSHRWSEAVQPQQPAFSADGARLALVSPNEAVVLDPHGVAEPVEQAAQEEGRRVTALAAFNPQGDRLERIAFDVLPFRSLMAFRTTWGWNEGRWAVAGSERLLGFSFRISPDGGALAWTDGSYAGFADLKQSRSLGMIRPAGVGTIHEVEFHDDATAVIGDGDSRLLVPWKLLLGIG